MNFAKFCNCLAESVTLLWLAYRIGLLNSVDRWRCTKNFSKNGANLYAYVHGRRKDFIHGGGGKSGVISFLLHERRNTAFFVEMFKFLPHFQHLCLCVGNSWCHTIKTLA